ARLRVAQHLTRDSRLELVLLLLRPLLLRQQPGLAVHRAVLGGRMLPQFRGASFNDGGVGVGVVVAGTNDPPARLAAAEVVAKAPRVGGLGDLVLGAD